MTVPEDYLFNYPFLGLAKVIINFKNYETGTVTAACRAVGVTCYGRGLQDAVDNRVRYGECGLMEGE